ncbi:MAG: hypothetical protein IAF58_12245 [Leptolyngbya sp.]|nr:hypothetical protein [Candidatus Melainabacteria bacterium]
MSFRTSYKPFKAFTCALFCAFQLTPTPAPASPAPKAKAVQPPLLQGQFPKFDPRSTKFELNAQESINFEILSPKSSWNKTYSIGRAAWTEGDYRRAFNAFKIALIKAKAAGYNDGRVKQTQEALDSVQGLADKLDARLGMRFDKKRIPGLFARVEKVFPGSLSWLAGVKADDRIISLKQSNNLYQLQIKRDGRFLSIFITDTTKVTMPNFTALSPASAPLDSTNRLIGAQITNVSLLHANEKLLTNHDLVLFIDKSSSMNSPFEGTGLSQWDWCKTSAHDLFSVSAYFPLGITVVMFDSNYEVLKGRTARDIEGIFQHYGPSGGTDLAKPFWEQLSEYFNRRSDKSRPMIFAVISDFGTSGEQIREGVYEAARRVRTAQELTISLLEVGKGGGLLVQTLDTDLVNVGARFDIVDATSSEDLAKIGLKNALIAGLLKRQPKTAAP